jgi:uncharacterized membrane protein required for colicin V production
MNAVDIVLILGCLLTALRGWRVGLLLSLASLLSVLVGYAMALAYGSQVAGELAGGSAESGSGSDLVGFVLVFILTTVACYLVGRVIHTVVRATPFGLFDGAAGAIVGAAGGILVLGLVTILLRTHPPMENLPSLIDESTLGESAQRTALMLVDAINTGLPSTSHLQEILGVRVDPSEKPLLVDRISDQASSAKARLESLLQESRKRLEKE